MLVLRPKLSLLESFQLKVAKDTQMHLKIMMEGLEESMRDTCMLNFSDITNINAFCKYHILCVFERSLFVQCNVCHKFIFI